MSHRISTATVAEAEEIAAHVNAAYRGDSSRAGWTTEADLVGGTRTDADQLRSEIALPNGRIELLRDTDGKLLASVQLVRETAEQPTCYLGMLTVRPTRQTAGLGKVLLTHAEQVAREWGCDRIRLTVIDQRLELMAYYERRGYVRTGHEFPFHFDDPRFGMPKLTLKMVEFEKRV